MTAFLSIFLNFSKWKQINRSTMKVIIHLQSHCKWNGFKWAPPQPATAQTSCFYMNARVIIFNIIVAWHSHCLLLLLITLRTLSWFNLHFYSVVFVHLLQKSSNTTQERRIQILPPPLLNPGQLETSACKTFVHQQVGLKCFDGTVQSVCWRPVTSSMSC